MRLSLILATVGRFIEVRRLMDSLAAQTDQEFELIVVDQNADSRLAPIVDRGVASGLQIQYHRHEQPNLSGARNLGVSVARNEVLGFPDDDCWYEPHVIEQVRRTFNASPGIGGVVARWVEQDEAKGSLRTERTLLLQKWRKYRGGDVSSISLFFQKDLFARLGGFDDRLGVGRWYGAAEEIDFLLRALSAGEKLVRQPDARVHHAYAAEPRGQLTQAWRSSRCRARGTGAIYAKHRLGFDVVLRGLTAPVLMPLIRLRSPRLIAIGVGMVLGRLEGMMRWKACED